MTVDNQNLRVPDGPRWSWQVVPIPVWLYRCQHVAWLGKAVLWVRSGLGGQGLPGAVKPRSFALNMFLLKFMKGRIGVPRTQMLFT